jgi:hypothetical protein
MEVLHLHLIQKTILIIGNSKMEDIKLYTVTAFSTHFVEAKNENEALDIVYEALLGNDKSNILSNGEVHQQTMIARQGYHSTIEDKEYK